MYRAKIDGDIGIKSCKIIGNKEIIGYKKINEYFVDNSGLGAYDEPALTFDRFLNHVKQGLYYGIISSGQFQVYIGEYKKVNRKKHLAELNIITSKKVKNNTRLTEYKSGTKVLTLHQTDIITWTTDGKIILNSGGWQTVTTKSRMNEFLPCNIRVYQNKRKWYISENDKVTEFFDGIELQAEKSLDVAI